MGSTVEQAREGAVIDRTTATASQTAAYLDRGKTYVVYNLDENLREISRAIVARTAIPQAVADQCDRYEPHSFREVPL